jgi:hypothetical protein
VRRLFLSVLLAVALAASGGVVAAAEPEPPPPPAVTGGSASLFGLPAWVFYVLEWQDQAQRSAALEFIVASVLHERLDWRWLPVHNCEQPGNWYAAGRTSSGYFEGGLGISRPTWDKFNAGLPESALDATPLEQMIVAQRVYDYYGPSAWGCNVP